MIELDNLCCSLKGPEEKKTKEIQEHILISRVVGLIYIWVPQRIQSGELTGVHIDWYLSSSMCLQL